MLWRTVWLALLLTYVMMPLPPEVTAAQTVPPASDHPVGRLEEIVLERVYFDYDSCQLTQAARDILDRNAAVLHRNPSVAVRVEGHTDERGSHEYTLALGERLARNVIAYLVGKGVNPAHLTAISHGKERPLDPGHDGTAWARNSRVELLEIR